MKNIFKLIFASITSFLFIFTLAACNQIPEESSSASNNSTTSTTTVAPTPSSTTTVPTTTTTPVKTEAEIKENFNKELAKVSLSKASINEYIDSVVANASDVDFDTLVSQIKVPATKVSLNSIKEDNSVETLNYYQWQNENKIYFGSNNDTVESYYLDLNAISELLKSLPTQGEDMDYVDAVLSLLNITDSDFDLDTYLGYINFNADDFSYENGVFTFDKTSLINYLEKVLEIKDEASLTLISNFVNLILTKFEINIKYDGEKFTEFNVEIKVNVKGIVSLTVTDEKDLDLISDDSYVSLSFNLTLNYLNNIFTSAQIELNVEADVKDPNTKDNYLDATLEFSCNLTPLLVESSLSLDLDYSGKITDEYYDVVTDLIETEEYVKTLKVNFTNINRLNILNKELTNELVLTAKKTLDSEVVFDLSVNVLLSLKPSKLNLSIKLNNASFIGAEINFADNQLTDGKVNVYPKVLVEAVGSGSSISTDYVKGEIILETKDVVIPDALLNNEDAIDILSIFNAGTPDTPTPYNN